MHHFRQYRGTRRMILCYVKVIDKVSSLKCESLHGIKLLAVEECTGKGILITGEICLVPGWEYVMVACQMPLF